MLKIGICDFWHSNGKGEVELWKRMFGIENWEHSDINPDLLITTCFGRSQMSLPTKRIFVSGENIVNPYWGYNYDMDKTILFVMTNRPEDFPEHMRSKICFFPHFYYLRFLHETPRVIRHKKKFCCFNVRKSGPNTGSELRKRFFDLLSTYKKVDAGGPFLNNIGFCAPEGRDEYLDFIGQYKFMITFENSFGHGYVTEKIHNAFLTGTVPIYYGDHVTAKEFFNEKSFLYLDTGDGTPAAINSGLNALLEKVIEIDNDDEKYQAMLGDPFLPRIDEYMVTVRNRVKSALRDAFPSTPLNIDASS
jgi:hypothetical protein